MRSFSGLALLLCLYSTSQPSRLLAQLIYCNHTSVAMDASVAYVDNSIWHSTGWFHLEPGNCKTAITSSLSNRYFYGRAEEVGGKRVWEGLYSFCASRQPFNFTNCSSNLLRKFFLIDVLDANEYTQEFTCTDCPALPSQPPMPSEPGVPQNIHLSGEQFAHMKEALDWCMSDSKAGGSVDCVPDYIATYPACWASGGRACLMGKASESAKANDCANAYRLALICQCHNKEAQGWLQSAGQEAICQYLGPPNRTPPPATPPPPPSSLQPAPPRIPFWETWRFYCQGENGMKAGACQLTKASRTSCHDAENLIQQEVQKFGGDACKVMCGKVRDDSIYTTQTVNVTGAGPCSTHAPIDYDVH